MIGILHLYNQHSSQSGPFETNQNRSHLSSKLSSDSHLESGVKAKIFIVTYKANIWSYLSPVCPTLLLLPRPSRSVSASLASLLFLRHADHTLCPALCTPLHSALPSAWLPFPQGYTGLLPQLLQDQCHLLSEIFPWLTHTEWQHHLQFCAEKSLALYCGFTFTSLVAQRVKHLPAMLETRVRSLGWEDPLEKEMATHSRILAWRIPCIEEPGMLQSMGSQRIGHDWAISLSFLFFFFYCTLVFVSLAFITTWYITCYLLAC